MRRILGFCTFFPIGVETGGPSSPKPAVPPFPDTTTSQSHPIVIASSSLFEKVIEVEIFDNGTVKCHRERYYPWYKEIENRKGIVSMEEVEKLLELFSNLTGYGEYIDKVSGEFMKEGHILEPVGNVVVSCLPLNKTLKISFRPTDLPELETITPSAEGILTILTKRI
ncbi:MAG: hypothetical protein QXQ47_02875 [Candidatus Bathyarchaeia archaeon]